MSFRRQHIRNVRTACEAGTPLDGEYVFDQTLKAIRAGDGTTLGGILHKLWGKSYTLSPSQITGNQNDYNPTDLALAETLLINSDAARSITGLQNGAVNRTLAIVNNGSFNITLVDASASSSAANRFSFGADLVLRPKASALLIYSVAATRWLLLADGLGFRAVTDLPENVTRSGDISPAQITGNTNDYNPTGLSTASVLRLSTDASRNLTGLAGGADGREIEIHNTGTNPLVLKNADAGSTAANRFLFGADISLTADQAIKLWYDATSTRWRQIANTAGAAVAAGGVIAQTLAGSAVSLGQPMINGTIVESHAGNAVTFNIKTLAGAAPSSADPVLFPFNDGAGGYVLRSLQAALSLTISSGSSLGAVNGTPFRVHLTVFDDGGTLRLGASKQVTANGIKSLHEGMPASSTAEGGGGGADSAGVIYTGSAVSSKYFRWIGYADYDSGLATAGTWNASPSRVILAGPGVARPGEVLGSVSYTTTSDTSNSTTSYVDTTLTGSIDVSNPCNGVAYDWGGVLAVNNAGIQGTMALRRGGSVIGLPAVAYNAAGANIAETGKRGVEFPGASGTLTYVVSIKSGTAANTVHAFAPFAGGEGGQLNLAEVQA